MQTNKVTMSVTKIYRCISWQESEPNRAIRICHPCYNHKEGGGVQHGIFSRGCCPVFKTLGLITFSQTKEYDIPKPTSDLWSGNGFHSHNLTQKQIFCLNFLVPIKIKINILYVLFENRAMDMLDQKGKT